MLVAVIARVLAQLILVLCFAAGMAASCIIFVLYGPVPVRRKVTIVPRLSPPDVFARPAVKVVSLPNVTVRFDAPAPQAVKPAPKPEEPKVAPLVLRRPRGESPPPLPRSRSARGTERRPRPSELELTQERTLENTLETPLVSFDDDAFLEDGR